MLQRLAVVPAAQNTIYAIKRIGRCRFLYDAAETVTTCRESNLKGECPFCMPCDSAGAGTTQQRTTSIG
jgi:hypothetical protein